MADMAGSADRAAHVGKQPGQVSRTVRVVVSSTFADMQKERDELVKQVIARCTELARVAIEERVAEFRRTTASGGS